MPTTVVEGALVVVAPGMRKEVVLSAALQPGPVAMMPGDVSICLINLAKPGGIALLRVASDRSSGAFSVASYLLCGYSRCRLRGEKPQMHEVLYGPRRHGRHRRRLYSLAAWALA